MLFAVGSIIAINQKKYNWVGESIFGYRKIVRNMASSARDHHASRELEDYGIERRVSGPRRYSKLADFLAIRAYSEGSLDQALDDFRQAEKRGPLTTEMSIFLMRTEYRLGKFPQALETLRRILSDDPRQAEALDTGGRIANTLQDRILAEDFWAKLADADPRRPGRATAARAACPH